MDELQARNKQPQNRKGSKPEIFYAERSYLNRSPPPMNSQSKIQNPLEQDKLLASYRVDFNRIIHMPQRKNIKSSKNIASSYLIDKSLGLDPSTSQIEQSRNDSPVQRSKQVLMGKVLSQKIDVQSFRPMTKGSESYILDPNIKANKPNQSQKPRNRAASNPRTRINNLSSLFKNPNLAKRRSKQEISNPLIIESARLSGAKQGLRLNESHDLSISIIPIRKPTNSMSKLDQYPFKEVRQSQVVDQQSKNNSLNRAEQSHLQLKQLFKYLDQDKIKLGASLSRELHGLELAIKKEGFPIKLVNNKGQKALKVPLNLNMGMNMNLVEQYMKENNEYEKAVAVPEEQPIGTQEFYEDFFSADKMTFEFERAMVSQRSKSQKDYFTPETSPAYLSNPVKNYYSSNRDTPVVVSYRSQDRKYMREEFLE